MASGVPPVPAAAAGSTTVGERLSVSTAVVGLLAVGGKALDAIWDLTTPSSAAALSAATSTAATASTSTNAPDPSPPPPLKKRSTPALTQALLAVRQCRSTVHILFRALAQFESNRLPLPARAACLAVDDLVAVLADTVLAFSDLQAALEQQQQHRHQHQHPHPHQHQHQQGSLPPGRNPDTQIGALSARIRWLSLTMTMMTDVLKCPGDRDAENARLGLERRMKRLLTSNTHLASRMNQLSGASPALPPENDGDSVSLHTGCDLQQQEQPPPLPPPPPHYTPQRPRPHISSPFAGRTLDEVPLLAAVPLPVTTDELFRGADGGGGGGAAAGGAAADCCVYTLAYARRVSRDLGDLLQYQAGSGASCALGVILGRGAAAEGSSATGGSTSSSSAGSHSTNDSSGSTGGGSGGGGGSMGLEAGSEPAKKMRFRRIRAMRKWRA